MCPGWPGQGIDLAQKPHVVDLDLNRWFRIDTPGHDKVTAITSRGATELTSNAVDVDILPLDADWDIRQPARALGKMSRRENGGAAEVCKALNYLESEDVELAMAKNYRVYDYGDLSFHLGLINARNRNRAGALFIAERFDGVKAGGFPGGVDAENEADGAGDQKGDQDPGRRKGGMEE